MNAYVLLATPPSAIDSVTTTLGSRPGFLGLEELPRADAQGFDVPPQFQVVEHSGPTLGAYTDWLTADSYRPGDRVWLRAYVDVADPAALHDWVAAWDRDHPDFPIRQAEVIPAQNYVALAQQQHRGRCVGQRFWVGPPWDTPPPGRLAVLIEPGMAFGTGDHPTTRLCLELLESMAMPPPRQILDVGTGSGVLAIAAAKLFPGSELWLLDTDAQCAENLTHNFQLNGLAGHAQHAFFGDQAWLENLDAPREGFALVMANIYSEVLQGLLPAISRRLSPGGCWIASGFTAGEQERAFVAALAGGLSIVERRAEESPSARLGQTYDTWVALRLQRNA